jgi:asparagine synthase (glutamine-hydrolysing)
MGYIAAVRCKRGESALENVICMLKASGGPPEAYIGLASAHTLEVHRRPHEFSSLTADSVMGFKGLDLKDYPPQPLSQPSGSMCLNGSIFGVDEPDTLAAANILRDEVAGGVKELLSLCGHFAVVIQSEDEIVCGRDQVGVKPLYYGENGDVYAVASNRKMLWSIDVDPRPVEPGHIVTIRGSGVEDEAVEICEQEKLIEPEKSVVETLDAVLSKASDDIARRAGRGALAFSGGIDSTLTAHYLRESGVDLDLVCVGLGQRDEYGHAQEAADALNMDLHTFPFTQGELEEALPVIIYSVEECSPLNIGVAAPLYFVAAEACGMGHDAVFTGNGSDELFGGYMKYSRAYAEDPSLAEEMMSTDVADSWKNNYERDSKIFEDAGLNLQLLFAHPRVVSYGLRIPVNYKLPPDLSQPRKTILRKLAQRLGLPEEVWGRPKKAVQYSTGVQGYMKRLAKAQGKSLQTYTHGLYKQIREGTHFI